MQFTSPGNQAFSPVPREMKEMWTSYGLTCNFLRAIFQNGVILSENLSHFPYNGSVEHGVAVTVVHGLGRIPAHLLLESGRVEFFQQRIVDATKVILLFRLVTTLASSVGLNTMTDRLTTTDASFFQENDPIYVDGNVNKVVSISGNSLILQSRVSTIAQHTVSLAAEQVKLLIM